MAHGAVLFHPLVLYVPVAGNFVLGACHLGGGVLAWSARRVHGSGAPTTTTVVCLGCLGCIITATTTVGCSESNSSTTTSSSETDSDSDRFTEIFSGDEDGRKV